MCHVKIFKNNFIFKENYYIFYLSSQFSVNIFKIMLNVESNQTMDPKNINYPITLLIDDLKSEDKRKR